jgi:hypothetical protein
MLHSLHQRGAPPARRPPVLRWAMRVLVLLVLTAALGCKANRPAAVEPNRDPYKNVLPAKVKERVEKINAQHEEQLDKQLESAK